MKWHAPTERTQLKLMLPILIVMGIVAMIFTAFVRLDEARVARQRRKGWHRWFAWRPVRLGAYRSDPWVWFEAIERHAREYRQPFAYRLRGGAA